MEIVFRASIKSHLCVYLMALMKRCIRPEEYPASALAGTQVLLTWFDKIGSILKSYLKASNKSTVKHFKFIWKIGSTTCVNDADKVLAYLLVFRMHFFTNL